jgi:hypothetical protein
VIQMGVMQGDGEKVEEGAEKLDLAQHLLSFSGLTGSREHSDNTVVVNDGDEVRRVFRHVALAETLVKTIISTTDHRHLPRPRHLRRDVLVVEIVLHTHDIRARLHRLPLALLVALAHETPADLHGPALTIH